MVWIIANQKYWFSSLVGYLQFTYTLSITEQDSRWYNSDANRFSLTDITDIADITDITDIADINDMTDI